MTIISQVTPKYLWTQNEPTSNASQCGIKNSLSGSTSKVMVVVIVIEITQAGRGPLIKVLAGG